MRFHIHDINALKRKAKYLKKYLSHPFIGRPDIELGAIQRTLAVALGYADWAELSLISKRESHGHAAAALPFAAFRQTAMALEGLAGIDASLADALTLRMGFTPGANIRTPATKAGFPNLRCADVLLDRLLEVDAESREASIIRQALHDIYERVVSGLHDVDQIHGNLERSAWQSRKAAAEWLETVSIYMGWELLSWRDRSQTFKLPVTYVHTESIVKYAEQLPSAGVFVMSGCFGSGRSTTPRLLSLAKRRGQATMFHMASDLRPLEAVTPCAVYRGEMREVAALAAIAKDAESKLVMVQLAAGSIVTAHHRVMEMAKVAFQDDWKEWLDANLVNGLHHEWKPERRPDLVQYMIEWWPMDERAAQVSREYPPNMESWHIPHRWGWVADARQWREVRSDEHRVISSQNKRWYSSHESDIPSRKSFGRGASRSSLSGQER